MENKLIHTIPLTSYLKLGGKLENLTKENGARIHDEYNCHPFLRDQVGDVFHILPNGESKSGEQLYRVTYENGKVRETLAQCWIQVTVKFALSEEYTK
jgi:hypothetical protein